MLALVSRPPVKTPSASPARSKSLISSPCSRMIWPISPSPGTPRCRAVASLRNFRDPDTAPNTPVPPVDTSKRAEPSCRNVSRSSSGSPSSSQITRNGTGNAKCGTRSTTPSGDSAASRSTSSSWASTIAAIRGRSRSSRRIVNSGVSSRRSRVWSGGSVKPSPPMSPSVVEPRWPMNGRMSLL